MESQAAVAVTTVGNSVVTIAADHRIDDIYTPSPRTQRATDTPAEVRDYVVDVSRPVVPWRWTSLLLAPVELLAVAWSIPFVVLLIGIPIVLAVALVHWAGRVFLSYF